MIKKCLKSNNEKYQPFVVRVKWVTRHVRFCEHLKRVIVFKIYLFSSLMLFLPNSDLKVMCFLASSAEVFNKITESFINRLRTYVPKKQEMKHLTDALAKVDTGEAINGVAKEYNTHYFANSVWPQSDWYVIEKCLVRAYLKLFIRAHVTQRIIIDSYLPILHWDLFQFRTKSKVKIKLVSWVKCSYSYWVTILP